VTADAPVYVYAIVRRRQREGIGGTGVGTSSAPVRVVEGDAVAAVVSDVPASWRSARREDLATHDRILSGLIEHHTVVPMRFGVVMRSDGEVRERLLERHGAALATLLDQLDGRVQMSMKAYYADEALLREVLARHPDLKQRSDALDREPLTSSQPARIALGRDVAAAVEEQRALDERALTAPLADLAEDIRVDAPVSERQAVALQLLVPAKQRPRLDAAVERLVQEQGERFVFRYVGPLPPYSFADLALEGVS
jgi:Gas vesicle synthesis protein GvpL/GvpF